jgi:hypothetical protein
MKHLQRTINESATFRFHNLRPGQRITIYILKPHRHRRKYGRKRRHSVIEMPDAVHVDIDDSRAR